MTINGEYTLDPEWRFRDEGVCGLPDQSQSCRNEEKGKPLRNHPLARPAHVAPEEDRGEEFLALYKLPPVLVKFKCGRE
jgi:hypothetical protein